MLFYFESGNWLNVCMLRLFFSFQHIYTTYPTVSIEYNFIFPNVASLVALSKLGVDSEPERSDKKPTESPLKARRLEKSKTTLLAHTESNSGQTKPLNEGRHTRNNAS